MKTNNRYKIKTPNGFKEFFGMKRIKKDGITIIFDDCYVICTKDHRIKSNNNYIRANTLKIGDSINGKKIIDIYECENTFYDVIGVQGNEYISGDFTHHNCSVIVVDETAFIKTSLWNDFIDSIAPTQSALSWRKNIYLSTANGFNHFKDMCEKAQKLKVYKDLPKDTQIELDNGKLVFLEDYYELKNKQ